MTKREPLTIAVEALERIKTIATDHLDAAEKMKFPRVGKLALVEAEAQEALAEIRGAH